MSRAEDGDYEFRFYYPGDESQIVEILGRCLHSWKNRDETYWRWQHLERPEFGPEDVLTVHHDGEMVACFHGAILPLRLDEGLEMPVSWEGDFAVLPEHRGLGIPTRAHDIRDRRLAEHGVVLRGGFTSRELNERFYHRRYGYTFIPTDTVDFRKALLPTALRHKSEELGSRVGRRLHTALERRPLVVGMRVGGLPPCHLELSGSGFRLHMGEAEAPDLMVRLPYRLLVAMEAGTGTLLWRALVSLLLGRLRAGGVVRNAPLLVGLAWAALADRLRP